METSLAKIPRRCTRYAAEGTGRPSGGPLQNGRNRYLRCYSCRDLLFNRDTAVAAAGGAGYGFLFICYAGAHEVAARGNTRILRHGLAVAELAENDLPGVPSAVFAFKEVSPAIILYFNKIGMAWWHGEGFLFHFALVPHERFVAPNAQKFLFFRACCSPVQRLTDDYDRYIVLSFTNATMVLEVNTFSMSVRRRPLATVLFCVECVSGLSGRTSRRAPGCRIANGTENMLSIIHSMSIVVLPYHTRRPPPRRADVDVSITPCHPLPRSQVQESVEEVENSGFLATSSTLDVKLMANNKILQVRITTTGTDIPFTEVPFQGDTAAG